MRTYFICILSNEARMLYTGVTNNIQRRVFEHRQKQVSSFTSRYNLYRLVYFEAFGDIRDAIAREKQIKGWRRSKKLVLIRQMNPQWQDLAAGWYPRTRSSERKAPSSLHHNPRRIAPFE